MCYPRPRLGLSTQIHTAYLIQPRSHAPSTPHAGLSAAACPPGLPEEFLCAVSCAPRHPLPVRPAAGSCDLLRRLLAWRLEPTTPHGHTCSIVCNEPRCILLHDQEHPDTSSHSLCCLHAAVPRMFHICGDPSLQSARRMLRRRRGLSTSLPLICPWTELLHKALTST